MASALVRKKLLLGTVGAFISGVIIFIMPICLNVVLKACLEARLELMEGLPYLSIYDPSMLYMLLVVISVFVILLRARPF